MTAAALFMLAWQSLFFQGMPFPGGGLVHAQGGGTSPSLFQSCSAVDGSPTISTLACNFTNNITAGNAVVIVSTQCCVSSITSTAADGPGDTLTAPTGCTKLSWHTTSVPVLFTTAFYAQSSAGGSKSATVNYSGGTASYSAMQAFEISNSGTIDGNCTTQALNASASFPSVTNTTANVNEYIMGFFGTTTTPVTATAGSGFTLRQTVGSATTGYGIWMQDRAAATATTYTNTFSDGAGTQDRFIMSMVIK